MAMADAPDPDQRAARITRVDERLRAAALGASQAQEHLALARDRLAQAHRALREARSQETADPATDRTPMDAT